MFLCNVLKILLKLPLTVSNVKKTKIKSLPIIFSFQSKLGLVTEEKGLSQNSSMVKEGQLRFTNTKTMSALLKSLLFKQLITRPKETKYIQKISMRSLSTKLRTFIVLLYRCSKKYQSILRLT
jgi:hypothetical protein